MCTLPGSAAGTRSGPNPEEDLLASTPRHTRNPARLPGTLGTPGASGTSCLINPSCRMTMPCAPKRRREASLASGSHPMALRRSGFRPDQADAWIGEDQVWHSRASQVLPQAHMNAAISRAMAVVTTVDFLPRWLSLRYRAVKRDCAFQAMSCTSAGWVWM